MKNIILNNKGAVSPNTFRGLSIAVFAVVILGSVYLAYNNSPAYNPERRALFTAEDQNLSVNSFDTDGIALQTSDVLPEGTPMGYGQSGKDYAGNSVQGRIRQNEAEFENARAYLEAQKAGANAAQSGAVSGKGATNSAANGKATNPMLTPQGGAINSFDKSVNGADDTAAYVASAIGGANGGQDGQEGGKAAKAKPQNAADKASRTVINKLASSGGSSAASAGGSAGAGGGFGGGAVASGNSRGGQDSSAQALPSANVAGTANGSAFKAGRGGTMGGYNVVRGGGAEVEGKRGGEGSTKGDLNRAHFYSNRAKQSLYSAGGKNMASAASDAGAAFDGSRGDEGGARIEGDNVASPDPRSLGSHKQLRGAFRGITDSTQSDSSLQEELIDSGTIHLMGAVPIALAAMICICGLKKAALSGGPYAWLYYVAIAAVAFAALYALWGADYDGNGHSILTDMSDLYAVNKRLGNSKWIQVDSYSFWLPWVILPTLTAGIFAAAIWGQKINFEGSGIGKRVMNIAEGKMTTEMGNQVLSEVNKNK